MLRFASPYFLVLLLLLPALAWYRFRRHRPPAMAHSALFPAADIPASTAMRLRRLVPAAKYMVFCLLVLALARPQWGTRLEEITRAGVDVVIVLDTSLSMSAEDVPPSRIDQARQAAAGLIDGSEAIVYAASPTIRRLSSEFSASPPDLAPVEALFDNLAVAPV